MNKYTVGIVGYGAFGTLIHTLITHFAPSVHVKVYSSRKNPDGETFFPLEEIAEADAVFLAVPIHAFEETLVRILPLMRKETVIVDVATVKVHTTNILKRLCVNHPFIATHPMWGPESYSKRNGDVSGFRIVISEHTLPEAIHREFVAFLKQCGFDVVAMTPEAHDKHLAETLFITHFIGQIISRAGFTRTEIDTVSFGFLMDATESVRHDEELFRDVFRFNPYCKQILDRFEISEKEVRAMLEKKEQNA